MVVQCLVMETNVTKNQKKNRIGCHYQDDENIMKHDEKQKKKKKTCTCIYMYKYIYMC